MDRAPHPGPAPASHHCPCPPPPQLPFSSDLSAGLLVLSPNLPRGPSPGAPTLPLFQERLPRARAQPRVPPHASMAGWQTDLCGRLERQGLSHMRGWHLAAALIVASETLPFSSDLSAGLLVLSPNLPRGPSPGAPTLPLFQERLPRARAQPRGMPSCWAGERMGQPPNTHVGGQGRTPASAVMAITLAQATCVRASVGALGVSGAQQRVMEAERPVHGDMSLAPVSPSPLAYGQSSTSRPCPRLTSLPMPTPCPAAVLLRPLRRPAGAQPQPAPGPVPRAPTLPLFQERLPRARAQPRVPPHASMAGWQTDLCGDAQLGWAGERMGQPPNTHVGGQGRTPASAVMAITLAQATCVRASVGALGVSGAQQRVMEAERPVHGDMSLAPVSPSPLAYGQSSTSRPCPPPHITAHAHLPQLPFSSDLSAGLLVLSPNLPRGPSPGAPTLPLFQGEAATGPGTAPELHIPALPPPHITAHAHAPAQLPFSSDLSAGLLVLSPNLPRGPSPGPQHCPSSRRGCHGPGHSPGYLPTPPWRAGRPTCAVAWNGKGCRT
ncbi:MAG: hypothetical protein WDW36_010186 [Sanguina aurantia]